MGEYLDQFQRFSEGISQTSQQGIQGAYRKINEAQRAQAVSAQNQAKARRKQELDLYKSLYGKNRLSMADWQQADIDMQSQTLLDDWRNERISDEEMIKELQSIGTAADQYHKSWESALGDPDDEGNTATYYGNVNMVTDFASRGINDYEDSDQIPVGFQNGFEGITAINNDRENKLTAINVGIGEERFIDSFKDPVSGEWMITMGDPSDENSHKTMPRKAWIEQLPGPGTFLPELTDINLRTMPEVAASNGVSNYVKNRQDVDAALTEWFNNEMMTNKRFKKEIWNQFGESFFGDQDTKLKTSKDQWLTDGLLDIKYDTRSYQLGFEGVGGSWEAMVNDARNEFIQKYKAQNAEKGEQLDMSMEAADSRIKFEMFEKDDPAEREKIFKAYEDADNRNLLQRGANAMFGAFPAYSPDVIDNIDRMVEIPPTPLKAGSDSQVHAVALDRDKRMIAKVVTMIPGELSEIQIAAGLTEAPEGESVEYVLIDETIEPNFFQEVGKKVDPKSGNAVETGREHLERKYLKPIQQGEQRPMIPEVQTGETQLLPGEPADIQPDLESVYGNQDSTLNRDRDLARALKITFGNNPNWGMLYNDLVEAMNEDPSLTNKIMQGALEGRIPMVINGEVVYETVR